VSLKPVRVLTMPTDINSAIRELPKSFLYNLSLYITPGTVCTDWTNYFYYTNNNNNKLTRKGLKSSKWIKFMVAVMRARSACPCILH